MTDNTGLGQEVEETTLAECPVGLFWAGDTLGMKSEYGSNEGRIDAFIVESGEFLWGEAPQTIARQRAMKVRPVGFDDAVIALRTPTSDRITALEEGFRRGIEAAAKVAENVAAECQADEMQCDSEDKAGADWAFGGKIEAKRIATAIRSLSPDVGEG